MSDQIINLHDWLKTPMGQYVLAWEQAEYDRAVADIFGFNALQLGLPELDALQSNRMPQRWLLNESQPVAPAQGRQVALLSDFAALPFASASLDLVLLPHSLELTRDPHASLREVERVLVPEGKVVICGFNPGGLWGLRQWRVALTQRWGWGDRVEPEAAHMIGARRLRDWLRLLGFEPESQRWGCYRPPVRTQAWLKRWRWLDKLGSRWWPFWGSVYVLVAIKRVPGVRLLGSRWKMNAKLAGAAASVVRRQSERQTKP